MAAGDGEQDVQDRKACRADVMPRKSPKLKVLGTRIADARRIIDAQQVLLENLRINSEPTREAEGALRTYVSALMHLLDHEKRLKLEAQARKGETKKLSWARNSCPRGSVSVLRSAAVGDGRQPRPEVLPAEEGRDATKCQD
jgi:hypothetical protein